MTIKVQAVNIKKSSYKPVFGDIVDDFYDGVPSKKTKRRIPAQKSKVETTYNKPKSKFLSNLIKKITSLKIIPGFPATSDSLLPKADKYIIINNFKNSYHR